MILTVAIMIGIFLIINMSFSLISEKYDITIRFWYLHLYRFELSLPSFVYLVLLEAFGRFWNLLENVRRI